MKALEYKNLFYHLPVVSVSPIGLIVYANDAFLKFLDIAKSEILEKQFSSLISFCDNKDEARNHLNDAVCEIVRRKHWRGCVRLSRAADEYISIVASAIEGEDGTVKEILVVLYPENSDESKARVDEVMDGLLSNRFMLFFQPIVSNRTDKIFKYEALLRMRRDKDILTPLHFLSRMKSTKSFDSLTVFTIEEVSFYIALYHVPISLNLSLTDIEKHKDLLLRIFKEKPLVPHFLTIEVLEDELSTNNQISNPESFYEFLRIIKRNGVTLAIDDFGVKHSNWNRFLEFEPDMLKLDGSLIRNIRSNKYMMDVVVGLVDFAKKHDIDTVAEFIEDKETLEIVKELGVDYSQGYYLGKPLSAVDTFAKMPIIRDRKKCLN